MSEQVEIPGERIKGAESFHTWGSPEWRELYASDPLSWADNQIRMLNKALQENPNDPVKVEDRDILFQWRNAWLGEYNNQSLGTNKVEPQLEVAFQQRYTRAFEEAYKDADKEKIAKAKASFEGWKTKRSQFGNS